MGQNDPSKMMVCENGEQVLSKYRCLFEFDKYNRQNGCRDMTHLKDCGMFQFYLALLILMLLDAHLLLCPENIFIWILQRPTKLQVKILIRSL